MAVGRRDTGPDRPGGGPGGDRAPAVIELDRELRAIRIGLEAVLELLEGRRRRGEVVAWVTAVLLFLGLVLDLLVGHPGIGWRLGF